MKLKANKLKIIFFDFYNFFWENENIFLIICAIFISIIFTKTGHIQDDALITFRTAKNLALNGQLTYNLGESLPGSTSIIYALICSIFFKLSYLIEDKHIFLLINIFNSVLLSLAINLLSRKLKLKNKIIKFLTIFNPYFITLSHRGMETSLLATLLIFLLINIFEDNNACKIFVFIYSLLLCSFRIDGIILPFLIISTNYFFLLFHYIERIKKAKIFKKLKYCIAGSLIGLIINTTLNIVFFNSFLPHTALAKRIAYDQDFGLKTFLSNFNKYFIGHKSFLIPIPNNFEFIGFLSPFIVLVIVFLLFSYLVSENKRINSHKSDYLNNFLIKLDLAIVGLIYPLIYLALGKTFVWYYWTSALCVNILFICYLDKSLVRYFKPSNLLKYLVIGIYLITFLLRYIASVGVGIQESVFRFSIGNYVKNISSKNESLMLEPAGWIPYPTNLKIIDEVGLISKDFYNYLLKKEKKESIVSYWRKEKPEYLIQRNHIFKRKDSLANQINDEDYEWFTNNYKLIKKFDYEDLIKSEKSILKRNIMKISASTNYYLFKIK